VPPGRWAEPRSTAWPPTPDELRAEGSAW
jgi:hypothetical protein